MWFTLMIDHYKDCLNLLDINISRVLSVAPIYHLDVFEINFASTLNVILFSLVELH
jgi:hypothetical protein